VTAGVWQRINMEKNVAEKEAALQMSAIEGLMRSLPVTPSPSLA
jgi:hypothetical protein